MKVNKKLVRVLGGIFLILIMAAMLSSKGFAQPAPKPITWKAVEFLPVGDFQNKLFEELIDRVNKQSKGELTIRLAGGPEAIPPLDQPEAIRKGVVDIAMTPGSYFVKFVPEFFSNSLTELPPWELRERGWNDVFSEMASKKANVLYLGYPMHVQPLGLFTKKRVEKVAGFAGLKIRGPASTHPFIRALGAGVVMIPTGDVYTALERGVIDGYSAGWTHPIGKEKCYEVVKYIMPPFGRGNVGVFVNVDSWNRLPKHLQDLLKKLQAGLERELEPFYRGKGDEMRDPKYKLEIVEFPPAELKRYLDLFHDSGWKWMDENAPGYDVRLRELTRKK